MSEITDIRRLTHSLGVTATSQAHELQTIRETLYDLEAHHSQMYQKYEEQMHKLGSELHEAKQKIQRILNPHYPPRLGPTSALSLGHVTPGPRHPFHPKSQSISNRAPPSPQAPPPQQQQRQQQTMYQLAPQSLQLAAPPQPGSDLRLENVPVQRVMHDRAWIAFCNPHVPRVLDVDLLHTFSHESAVCCVRFSADGRYLATASNHSAQIYHVHSGQKTHDLVDERASSYKMGSLSIRSLCFSPDGKYLATAAEDACIRIWDITKSQIRAFLEGHRQEIYTLKFSSDGESIVSGSGDSTVRIWPWEGDGRATVLSIDEVEVEIANTGVISVAISPDDRFVAAGSFDNVVRIWEVATGNLIERLHGHQGSVYSVVFMPDGKLVSGSRDKTVKLWDIAALYHKHVPPLAGPSNARGMEGGEHGSTCLMDYKGHNDSVLSVAVSHDGQCIVSGSKDCVVQFWDVGRGSLQFTLQGHQNSVLSIDLSPTGKLATGSGDTRVRVWHLGH
ncbi:WD40 repeat-like protein [Auricularia subglabra TFB-10046 SS5]|uniref:WD40 repeat-like protein n=1 Tax=Auricularia subglabra (strain TFB-10046 / SS5) TaxID=717982 RepID=J0WQK7_AURST|nr:WD40 repeat-like protein [Auricularia subglabra TFB-10046 SS5]